jgi:hypothetical protein
MYVIRMRCPVVNVPRRPSGWRVALRSIADPLAWLLTVVADPRTFRGA